MTPTTPEVVDGWLIERTERVVEADPFPRMPRRHSPHPVNGLGRTGRWALGIGIPFAIATVTAFLLGAWPPSAHAPSGSDSDVITILQLAWAAGIVAGAVLMRSFWALVVVPLAAVTGKFLGWALAMVIFTAAHYGLAAGFDPSMWPQGGPNGRFVVFDLAVPASIALATATVVIARLAAAEVRRHKRGQQPYHTAS